MWDVLSALIPPTVVGTVFCAVVYTVLRREMAPKTSDGRPLRESDAASAETTAEQDADAAADDGAGGARGPSPEVRSAPGEEPGGR